jgi:hypothetical protein
MLAVALLATVGCVSYASYAMPVPVDDGLTFAAHETHAGLVIDRTQQGWTGVATPHGGFFHPVAVLHTADTVDAITVMGPGNAVVEQQGVGSSPEVGRIEPSWDNQAIKLTIRPANGPALQTGRFHRTDNLAGDSVLTRLDQDRIDLEGAYRANVRSADGRDVGWLGLVVGKTQPGHVMYEAVLPKGFDDGLAAGAAEALGSEIAYIESTTHGVSRKAVER